MRASRQGGFTLVELLAASAIVALVAMAAGMTLINVTQAQQRVDRQWTVQQEARVGIAAVAAALHNAYRPGDGDRNTLEGVEAWAGDWPDSRIRFFTVSARVLRPQHPESDVREVEFFILRDPTGARQPMLMRRTDPARHDPPHEGILERVAQGVAGMAIRYHDGRQWHDEWKSDADWPLAVQVRLMVVGDHDAPQDVAWTVSRMVHLPHRRPPQQRQNQPQPTQGRPR
jgi:general secretion pathway protein J